MTVSAYQVYRRPPPLYRVARTLRRISLLVLILLIVFTASAAYSAVLTAQSASHLGAISETFASNGTLVLSGTLTLNNNGIYEVQGLALSVRISNASGVLVGAVRVGPTDLPRQSSTAYPLTVYVPVSGSGPGPSLLTEDQSLPVTVWGNATLGVPLSGRPPVLDHPLVGCSLLQPERLDRYPECQRNRHVRPHHPHLSEPRPAHRRR